MQDRFKEMDKRIEERRKQRKKERRKFNIVFKIMAIASFLLGAAWIMTVIYVVLKVANKFF